MSHFLTASLPSKSTVFAPDGSDVRSLLALSGGGMANFQLGKGRIAHAVMHKTVEEIWYVIAGSGQIWRSQDGIEEVVQLEPGVCLTIPLGTHFQFRASPAEAISVVAVTMPPWPGEGEAVFVTGPWQPNT